MATALRAARQFLDDGTLSRDVLRILPTQRLVAMPRPNDRRPDDLRPLRFTRHFTRYAEGSVLVEWGQTRVICTASVEETVPRFLLGRGKGWVTAEYGMLPRATGERVAREAARGRQGGRTMEIQRLIGRSLRAAVDLDALGERSILLDCDVIQADGGTRTAAISGAFIALFDAIEFLRRSGKLVVSPVRGCVAAVSVGIFDGIPILDLEYLEDSKAETDMNVVMNEAGEFIEIQGTAESRGFRPDQLQAMIDLACSGIARVIAAQKAVLGADPL